jgi:ABC transport system ATP-binding/permease protein
MKVQLKFLNGPREGEVFSLREGRTVMGRQVGDITIADKEVSSIHAIVSFERGAWYVMDLGSTNGVWVNEQLRPEAELAHGTEIRFGQTRVLFCTDEEGELPAAPTPGPEETPPQPLDAGTLGAAAFQTTEMFNPRELAQQPMVRDEIQFSGALQEDNAKPGLAPFEIVLEVVEGADRGLVYRFNSETILLGRLNTDLVVRDSDVSRRHAIIEVFEDDLVYIRDLGSTNGTFVNGQRISTVKMNNGDKMKLGRCIISFAYQPL